MEAKARENWQSCCSPNYQIFSEGKVTVRPERLGVLKTPNARLSPPLMRYYLLTTFEIKLNSPKAFPFLLCERMQRYAIG